MRFEGGTGRTAASSGGGFLRDHRIDGLMRRWSSRGRGSVGGRLCGDRRAELAGSSPRSYRAPAVVPQTIGFAMGDTTASGLGVDASIKTWSELTGLVEEYCANRWIFRGVEDANWKLVPAIGRAGARKDRNTGQDLPFDKNEELAMLSRFHRECRPHVGTDRRRHLSHDWDLRAVAQHHGLRTRLLDWSESPLIAAFFAVEPSGIIDGVPTDAVLYGVPCPPEIDSDTAKWPAEHDVVAFYPPHLTPRISVQRGLFTVHQTPDIPWEPSSLRKWVIPSETCLGLKLALSRAGINRASLFPDLDGIAAHIDWLHKWGIQ